MRKFGTAVALLVLLTGCGETSATAPARNDVQLVASTREEAVEQCMTLENELVGDCLDAVVNTAW